MPNKLSPKKQSRSALLFSLFSHTFIQIISNNTWHAHTRSIHIITDDISWQRTHAHRMHIKALMCYRCLFIFYDVFAVACQMWLYIYDGTLKWSFRRREMPTLKPDAKLTLHYQSLFDSICVWCKWKQITQIMWRYSKLYILYISYLWVRRWISD